MGTVFRDARLKIKRANKHIADLKEAIASLKDTYTAMVQKDADTGYQNIVHTLDFDNVSAALLALIAGDAIHNLKSALDFAWYILLKKHIPTADFDHCRFPARETREGVINALNGVKITPTSNAAIFNLILTDIQPYDGGKYGSLVYTLHELDITDKHLLALGVHPVAGIEGIIVEQHDGEIIKGYGVSTDAFPPYVIPFEGTSQIKDKGELSFEIVLEKTGLYYLVDIIEVLSKFSEAVLHFVELMENI
jgi:hypothetical protein